mgnify:CR=1
MLEEEVDVPTLRCDAETIWRLILSGHPQKHHKLLLLNVCRLVVYSSRLYG